MGFCSDGPVNVPAKFEVRSFTRSWDNSDWNFAWGLRTPQSWGRGGRRGSGMVPFERALISSYRPSIVTFPLSLRVSEILPLLCSSTPLFPTPPLVSPKFPYVPLGVGGWPLGYEERTRYANCPCNYFPRFPIYVVLIHQRYGRTDGRHAIPIPRFALVCIAGRHAGSLLEATVVSSQSCRVKPIPAIYPQHWYTCLHLFIDVSHSSEGV